MFVWRLYDWLRKFEMIFDKNYISYMYFVTLSNIKIINYILSTITVSLLLLSMNFKNLSDFFIKKFKLYLIFQLECKWMLKILFDK